MHPRPVSSSRTMRLSLSLWTRRRAIRDACRAPPATLQTTCNACCALAVDFLITVGNSIRNRRAAFTIALPIVGRRVPGCKCRCGQGKCENRYAGKKFSRHDPPIILCFGKKDTTAKSFRINQYVLPGARAGNKYISDGGLVPLVKHQAGSQLTAGLDFGPIGRIR